MKKKQKKKQKSRISQVRRRETFWLDLMAFPGMLSLFVFSYLPMIGVVLAFKDYNPNLGIFDSPWCGFDNFKFFFTSQDALRTIRNTLGYNISFLILDLLAGVGLALLFYNLSSRRALKFYNTVVILPKFLSAVLIAFIVYIILDPVNGLANQLLMSLGAGSIGWYTEPKYWPFILTITHIWQTVGMNSIIYYASLMGLDDSLLEAASLDGANKFQQTIHIVIPHLTPLMVINTILNIGHLFEGDFGLFYQTPKNVGLLYATTDVINTYTFRALQEGALERSAAVGLFQSLTGMILVIVTNCIVRKINPENSLF